ncbi:MAG: PAS domain S-box protein [Planctomycetota bacterium]|jgi:PAS domain S-box-containing protein
MSPIEPVIIAAIDLVTVLACLIAMGFVLRGWKRSGLAPEIPMLFLLLAGLMALYGTALFLEWSGLIAKVDWHFLEDFAGVFIPFVWAFAFYVVDKSVIVKDLEISRTRFRNLVESTSDWIWEVDANGRYTYVSSRVRRVLGYTPEELLGKTPFDLMPPEEAARISKMFAGFVENSTSFQHLENLNLHKDGHEVYLETNGTPIFDDNGKLTGYRGVDRDITARKKAEQLTARRQAELNSIFAASPTGIGVVRDRKLVRGNARFAEITGYREDELIDVDPRMLYLSQLDYEEVGRKYQQAREEGTAAIETRWVRADDTVIDVVLYLSPLDAADPDKGFVAVVQDISELKAARQEATEEKTRSQTYLDVVDVMILVLDTAGRVKLINKKGCEIVGCSAEEVQGAEWFKRFLPGSYQGIAWNAFQRVLDGDERLVAYFENPIRTAGGAERLIAWHNTVLRDDSGQIVGIVSSGEDITEARAAEEAMLKSDQRLRVALSAAQTGTWQWRAATHQETRDANLNTLLGLEAVETTQDGEEFYTYVHPDDRDAVRQAFHQAIHGPDAYLTRFRIVRADGKIRWVLDQGKPFFDFNGKLEYITGAIVDITEQVEYQQRYRNVIDSAPMGILTYELDADDRLILTGSNRAANTILAHDFTPSVGKPVEEVFPELANTILPDEYRRICRKGGCYHGDNFEYRDERVSGFYEFDAFQTSPGNVAVAFTDVTERKLAEEQIRRSRDLLKQEVERFENMFHTIPDPIYMKDLDSRFTHVNEAYLKLAGLADEQDAIGKTDFDAYDKERAQSFYEDEQEILRTGIPKVGYEEKGLWLDGRVTWHLSTKMPLRDAAGNIIGLIGISHDITDRKRADQALQESEEKYRTIFHSGNQGFFLMTDVFLDCNDRVCEIWQCSPEEVIGHSPVEFSPEFQPDGRTSAEAAKAYIDAALAGRPQRFYWQHKRKDGQLVDTEITLDRLQLNEQTLLQATMSDITERKQTEQALQFTQFAVDRAGEAAYWMGKDGKFIYVNDLACQSMGYTREELLSMSVPDIDPDFPVEALPAHWEQLRKERTMRFESHHKTKNGQVFPVEISANFVEYDGQEYNCAFARDITERKVAEQMREVLMQQLRQRNDELQSIVFTTAHDLRSPLVNIAGFAGELEKGLQKLEETLAGQKLTKQAAKDIEYLIKTDIAESLGFVRSGSHHMDMLLNGLMRLSVVGAASIELAAVDMNDVFDSIIEGLQYQINENTIDISVPKDLPNCMGDFAMLTQVFGNLIDNAIKYRHPDRAAVIEIGASIQDDTVEYTVADNGIGIDSPHLEKVFELFHRLHPRQEQDGQGLGLTIVRRILDRLGGTARIESVPDRGTTVYVRLPCA